MQMLDRAGAGRSNMNGDGGESYETLYAIHRIREEGWRADFLTRHDARARREKALRNADGIIAINRLRLGPALFEPDDFSPAKINGWKDVHK